jgi:2-iminobutanoate/2-iminopropanoate deaminase
MIKVLTLNDRICAHRDNAGHATEVPPNARLLFCNGQVGARIDGTVPGDVGEQVEICFERIRVILKASRMGFQDIVKITVYFTAAAHLDHFYRIRPHFMGEHNPPVVLLCVGPFPRPGVEIEIEVVAAKAD